MIRKMHGRKTSKDKRERTAKNGKRRIKGFLQKDLYYTSDSGQILRKDRIYIKKDDNFNMQLKVIGTN
jgi:hypothetical protein